MRVRENSTIALRKLFHCLRDYMEINQGLLQRGEPLDHQASIVLRNQMVNEVTDIRQIAVIAANEENRNFISESIARTEEQLEAGWDKRLMMATANILIFMRNMEKERETPESE